MFDQTQVFWKGLQHAPKNKLPAYREAMNIFTQNLYNTRGNEHRIQDVSGALYRVLYNAVEAKWPNGTTYRTSEAATKPRRVVKTDIAFPTNRTTVFNCGEAEIRFDPTKKTVSWDVPDNNHACEHAREHPVAAALFDALDRVNWTRGSGGQIVGNNEYNQDNDYEGGGANYVTSEYGPKVRRVPKTPYYGVVPRYGYR